MGILTGNVGYLRFVVIGELPDELGEAYADALQGHAFAEIDPAGDEERAVGWVRFDDPFASEWAPAELGAADGRVLLRLRVDGLKVPGLMLKAYQQVAERNRLRQAGRDKLTRAEKDQIKLEVKKDLRGRSLPRMALHDVVWNLSSGEVRLFATSKAVAGLFVEIFEKTFAVQLRMLSPLTVLWNRGVSDEDLEKLAATEPERFHLDAGRRQGGGRSGGEG